MLNEIFNGCKINIKIKFYWGFLYFFGFQKSNDSSKLPFNFYSNDFISFIISVIITTIYVTWHLHFVVYMENQVTCLVFNLRDHSSKIILSSNVRVKVHPYFKINCGNNKIMFYALIINFEHSKNKFELFFEINLMNFKNCSKHSLSNKIWTNLVFGQIYLDKQQQIGQKFKKMAQKFQSILQNLFSYFVHVRKI